MPGVLDDAVTQVEGFEAAGGVLAAVTLVTLEAIGRASAQ